MANTQTITARLLQTLDAQGCVTAHHARAFGAKNPSATISNFVRKNGLVSTKTLYGLAYYRPGQKIERTPEPWGIRVLRYLFLIGALAFAVAAFLAATSDDVHAISFPWQRTNTERLADASETMNAAAQTYRAARLEYLRTQNEVANEKIADGRECKNGTCEDVISTNAAEIRAILGANSLPRFQ